VMNVKCLLLSVMEERVWTNTKVSNWHFLFTSHRKATFLLSRVYYFYYNMAQGTNVANTYHFVGARLMDVLTRMEVHKRKKRK